MSSTTRQIPPSEWDRHKDTIVELYRHKTLKDVRAEMQNLHGFNASSWQYEMQLKRWNVRKNATRKEWQQYFSNNEHPSIPTSIDASGTNASTVILSKSIASKKRAKRWVSGSHVEPSASQASSSALPGNTARIIAASIPNEPLELGTATQADVQDLSTNVTSTFGAAEILPRQMDPVFSNMVATFDFLDGPSPAFLDVVGENAQSLDLSLMPLYTFSSPAAPGLQSPVPRQNLLDGFMFQDVGLPSENNMVFFSMLRNIDFQQKLPSTELEHILRSKEIILDKADGHAIFGGFAPRFVAGILSSKSRSMAQQSPNLQHFLRKLGSQVPGESSALITDDQAFETKFARVLLFSMLNGFAGLDDVPIESILRFLNRFVVNRLLLDILEQCPRHVSRTLADNIFRAAIEATDTDAVKLLLDRKLVDANEIVCFKQGKKWTPIQRASELRSPRLMQALVDTGADVNKSYINDSEFTFLIEREDCGALNSLITGIKLYLRDGSVSTVPAESIEAFNILVAAGAQVHPKLMIMDFIGRTVELDLHISHSIPIDNHQCFFEEGRHKAVGLGSPIARVASMRDDHSATIVARTMLSLCHEASCDKCLVGFGKSLTMAVIWAAETGKIELLQLLLDKADLETELPRIFAAAIRSRNQNLIDFLFSHDPDPDPTAIVIREQERPSTPIAEAVRHGNKDLIRKLEEGGSLNRLAEGGRFEALVNAAAEAGDTAYMRKLLTRAVTSKEAYRIMGETLNCAIRGGHEDMVQMLLEAGALTKAQHKWTYVLNESLKRSNAQMVRDLIAAGAHTSGIHDTQPSFPKGDISIILDLVYEFPDLRIDYDFVREFLIVCIELDTLDSFKEICQTSKSWGSVPDVFLPTAVNFGHADLIGYLLDMGANPFDNQGLQAVIPDRPYILRLLFQKERLRQTMPKCIGARILAPVMGNGEGNAEALDELIRTEAINFARLEIVDDYSDRTHLTPLGLAIQGIDGRFDTNLLAMKRLLDAGADPDGISKSNERWTKGSPLMTALMVAIETGREDAINMLLDHGADLNSRPRIRTTRTALQYAAELGNMDMVRLLLSRGADVNSSASSRGGATALQFAAMSGNCNMAAHLLDHGAQLDALPSRIDGMWPLEGAAANGRLDMIRFLWELKMRADMAEMPYGGFSDRQCLRAMNFADENRHIGCRDFVSELSGISVDRLQTDEYGAPWIAY